MLMGIMILLIVWSFWPPSNERQTLTVNPGFVENSGWQDCAALNQLLDYEFELVAPRALWAAQSGNLLLTTRRVSGAAGGSADLFPDEQPCSLALETRLVMSNLQSQPGNVIIQPFVGKDTQAFIFTVTPQAKGSISGKLWVYADVLPADGGEGQNLPLFSIPLEMTVWTIFGQPPVLVRYVSLMLLLILLAFEFRRRLLAN